MHCGQEAQPRLIWANLTVASLPVPPPYSPYGVDMPSTSHHHVLLGGAPRARPVRSRITHMTSSHTILPRFVELESISITDLKRASRVRVVVHHKSGAKETFETREKANASVVDLGTYVYHSQVCIHAHDPPVDSSTRRQLLRLRYNDATGCLRPG